MSSFTLPASRLGLTWKHRSCFPIHLKTCSSFSCFHCAQRCQSLIRLGRETGDRNFKERSRTNDYTNIRQNNQIDAHLCKVNCKCLCHSVPKLLSILVLDSEGVSRNGPCNLLGHTQLADHLPGNPTMPEGGLIARMGLKRGLKRMWLFWLNP